ncbi:regulator of RNase E activity RraA [Murinocardiopsis flavida]|uniref:Putative 4-hydroxy-4-methyl-2-oxoglutarate aldolase n=1 Tax=Murinocardiopsis flavida TaxID=645275 RepID=A0A2P8CXB9_9ACTN|nr:ribonuclease activity regulator RraA [Murinocardiopsis flavida]PSK89614.1 regulator of RNase E activity RraA [Murinocardiopsis flavida]
MASTPESTHAQSGEPAAAEPLDEHTMAALHTVSTATLTTQLMDRGLRNTFMQGPRPLSATRRRVVGEAFTLRYIPGREDIDVVSVFQDYDHPQRRAFEAAPPGSVLVIDARGRTRAAALGNILATRFLRRGGAGIVTDGAVRDLSGFARLDLPTFACGAAPTTNLAQHHAVDMQQPIGCAEVPVYPGDVIVGDEDGVICVPRHLAASVAHDAAAQEAVEEFVLARIDEGRPLRGTYPPDERTLREYRGAP